MRESSVEKRKAGMSYYVFMDSTGDTVWLRADQADEYRNVASPDWILKQASNAINPILKARFTPTHAYPFAHEGMTHFGCIDESRYASIDKFWTSVKEVSAAWVIKGIVAKKTASSRIRRDLAVMYENAPLHFFMSVAERKMEIVDVAERGFPWDTIYSGSMTVASRDNLMGLIQDNCTVDMRHYEPDADYAMTTDPNRHKYLKHWDGFIDPSFTTMSLDAGNIMALVHSVQIRVLDKNLWSKTESLLSTLRDHGSLELPRDWTLYFYDCVDSMIGDINPDKGMWVDSYVFNNTNQHAALGISETWPSEALVYARTHLWLFPYVHADEQPRPMLGSVMAPQAIAFGSTSVASTISPVTCSAPRVMTPLGDLIAKSSPPDECILPGVDLIVLFANFKETYEDSMIASSEIATLGSSHARGFGYAMRTGYGKTKDPYVDAAITQSGIVPGDKIATLHGQKQTVSRLLSRDEMPWCHDPLRNKTFKPHIIMASSSVSNRMTAGQIYEAQAGASVVDVTRYHETISSAPYVTDVLGRDYSSLAPTTCRFTELGKSDCKPFIIGPSGAHGTSGYTRVGAEGSNPRTARPQTVGSHEQSRQAPHDDQNVEDPEMDFSDSRESKPREQMAPVSFVYGFEDV
uniref:DNA-directed RNA polymerase n=1 Tax=Ustilago esculenta TaxID=185366 RepID=A0A481SH47_9BASI|nr:hypothetical protein UE_1363 [Ustilago esculenta]